VKVKKILFYNFDSACVLSRQNEVYCWGILAGFYTDGPFKSKLLTVEGPSSESKNVLFGQPVKIPRTKALAAKILKLNIGGEKIKSIKAFYLVDNILESALMCAILSDNKFTCFPRPIEKTGNTWGQMTDFPVLSKKIGGGRVTNFWPWKESGHGDDRDPLPIVLVNDNTLIFGTDQDSVKTYHVTGYNPSGVRDVVADARAVNVLFHDGMVMGLNALPDTSEVMGSALQSKEFDLSPTSREARAVFDFGGPVNQIFTNSSNLFRSGTLCAWLVDNSLKCSGTPWGYGDGKPRLVTDPVIKGKNFPRIKL
jgi:hypothetical protein